MQFCCGAKMASVAPHCQEPRQALPALPHGISLSELCRVRLGLGLHDLRRRSLGSGRRRPILSDG
jgi:hypothetical protein